MIAHRPDRTRERENGDAAYRDKAELDEGGERDSTEADADADADGRSPYVRQSPCPLPPCPGGRISKGDPHSVARSR